MKRKLRRYSETFRRQVVSEYEDGASIPTLQRQYGITGATTIPNWISKYAKQGFRHETVRIQSAEEARRVGELEKQVRELQQALGQLTLEKLKLESTLEILQAEDLAKKNEPAFSNASGTRSNSKVSCK